MLRINHVRVLIAGLCVGLVLNGIDATTNGILLGAQWQAETNRLNPELLATVATGSTIGWILVDFFAGIFMVWLYAAIRPRFGPGPRTALLAGFMLWLVTHVIYASYVFMGLFSASLIGASSLGGLVGFLAGGYLGGMLYRE